MAEFRRIKRGPQLIAKLKKLRTGIQPEVQAGLLKAGDVIVAEQKRLAPVSPGGGTLRDSLKSELTRGTKSGNQAVKISTDVFYAAWVEFGTAPHTIKAVNAPALHLRGGIFVESVDHPGATAKPFFFPAYRANRKRARSIVSKAVRQAIVKAVK